MSFFSFHASTRMLYSLNLALQKRSGYLGFLSRVAQVSQNLSSYSGQWSMVAVAQWFRGRSSVCHHLKRHVQHQANIRDLVTSQVFQNWYQVEQLIVVRVAEPATDRHGVLRVEDVARRRVVDDDGLP